MSLPVLASLPAALEPLALRAEQSLQQAVDALSSEAQGQFAAWPAERRALLRRGGGARDVWGAEGLAGPHKVGQAGPAGRASGAVAAGRGGKRFRGAARSARSADAARTGRQRRAGTAAADRRNARAAGRAAGRVWR